MRDEEILKVFKIMAFILGLNTALLIGILAQQ